MEEEKSETEIRKEILDFLLSIPCISRAFQIDRIALRRRAIVNRYRPAGLPDIHGSLRGGRALYIEAKKNQLAIERAHEDQKTFINGEKINGSFAMFACDVESVRAALKEEGYKC